MLEHREDHGVFYFTPAGKSITFPRVRVSIKSAQIYSWGNFIVRRGGNNIQSPRPNERRSRRTKGVEFKVRHAGTKYLLAPGACLALVLALAAGVLAQAAEPEPVATKFDEYGQLGWCDLSARLDNFAIALQVTQSLGGYAILYGPEGDTPGNTKAALWALQDYLVNNRGINKERLKLVYGGRYQNMTETRMELWIVPEGAPPPDAKEYKNDSSSFTGKFAELHTYEGANGDGGFGPSTGDATVYGFADALRQQPKTRAYVVAYNSQAAATGAWRRAAKDIVSQLNSQGVPTERVKTIFAGYEEKLEEYAAGKVQLWILPEDAPPPAAEAVAERRPEKAVKLADLYDSSVGDADAEKRALEGFADVLRADEQLSACVIVHLPPEQRDPKAEPDQKSADDFLRLIERWKAQLVTDYKIDQTRLVVTVAFQTEEFSTGYLETWVVPQGAALPDPYAPQEVFEEAVAEESPQ